MYRENSGSSICNHFFRDEEGNFYQKFVRFSAFVVNRKRKVEAKKVQTIRTFGARIEKSDTRRRSFYGIPSIRHFCKTRLRASVSVGAHFLHLFVAKLRFLSFEIANGKKEKRKAKITRFETQKKKETKNQKKSGFSIRDRRITF